MYIHNNYVKSILFVTLTTLIHGCGSTQTETTHVSSLPQLQLDEENFFEVSQYIYTRQEAIRKAQKTKTTRTSPDRTTPVESSNPNILKVQANNGRVEIKQKQKTILVNVDNKNKKVIVFYSDKTGHQKRSSELKKFNDLNEEIN